MQQVWLLVLLAVAAATALPVSVVSGFDTDKVDVSVAVPELIDQLSEADRAAIGYMRSLVNQAPPTDEVDAVTPTDVVPCYACERAVATSYEQTCEAWCQAEWPFWQWTCPSLCADIDKQVAAGEADVCASAGYCDRSVVVDASIRPVVLFHGITATKNCMEELKDRIQHDFPGIYVHNVELGNGRIYSIFEGMPKQVKDFTAVLQDDPHLAHGFDVIAHSQGTLAVRGHIEFSNSPAVHNFVSISGPLGGQFGIPFTSITWLDDLIMKACYGELQDVVAPCSYWRDPMHLDTYKAKCNFLPVLDATDPTRSSRFASLNTLALQRIPTDRVICPIESEYFGDFKAGSIKDVETMEQREEYKHDNFGLRTLDAAGKIKRAVLEGCEHPDACFPSHCEPMYADAKQYLGGQLAARPLSAWFADVGGDPLALPDHELAQRLHQISEWSRTSPPPDTTPQQAVPCYACERTVETSYDTSCEDWCTAEWSWAWGWACSSLCRDVAAHAGDCITAGYCEDRVYDASYRPVVLMHGLLGNAGRIQPAGDAISEAYPGIYVANIELGNGRVYSMINNLHDQVDLFAKHVADDPALARGFDGVSHSQGTMIMRGYIHRYNSPPVHRFISLTGPQGGVDGVPLIGEYEWVDKILRDKGYSDWVQKHVAPAGYFRSPFNLDKYHSSCQFLPLMDNEVPHPDAAAFKQRFAALDRVVIVESTGDKFVIPLQAEWFGVLAAKSTTQIVPLEQRDVFTKDLFGLRTLAERKALVRVEITCSHLDVPHPAVCPKAWTDAIKPHVGTRFH